PKAIKEAEKRGDFDDPALFGRALLMLDRLYVAMKRDPGDHRRAAYASALSELGCEDQPCFGIKGQIKSFPEYSVMYRGDRLLCDQHIKFGGGTDSRHYFRIYYTWNDDDGVLVIGHLPTHLDNNLTN